MHIRYILFFVFFFPVLAYAQNAHDDHPSIFHALILEGDIGDSREGTLTTWDLDGWVGGDYHKLWLKSEGESVEGDLHRAEFWAMYSRNVAEFWDLQAGIRYDTKPENTSYLVAGFTGLAPYFFETEAHIFISDEGDLSARLRQENDILITQRLIAQPYFEINLNAQDIPEQEIGAGLSSGELGLQTRYEITRKFAPYIDIRYESKLGETSRITRNNNESRDDFITSAGIRLLF